MDIVEQFIKDQFNDDDDFKDLPEPDSPAREASNLKKELHELKMYQQRERKELEDMKLQYDSLQKRQSLSERSGRQKQHSGSRGRDRDRDRRSNSPKKSSSKKNSLLASHTDGGSGSTAPDDLFESLQNNNISAKNNNNISAKNKAKKHAALVEKFKEKSEELERLEKKFKAESDPKEFGKRMYKLEKKKDGEIEDIKNHYKGLMEQLAKEIKKANDRNDNEMKKNSNIRANMEKMRQDMASREQSLEEKVIEMEAVLNKTEAKTASIEERLADVNIKLEHNQVDLNAANANKCENEKRLRELEEDFEDERREIISTFEEGKDIIENNTKQEQVQLQNIVEDLQQQVDALTANLSIEKNAHEDTVAQIKEAKSLLEMKEREYDSLLVEAKEAQQYVKSFQDKGERETKTLMKECKKQLDENDEKIHKLLAETSALNMELKGASKMANAADKKAGIMSDFTFQKQGALQRKNAELEAAKHERLTIHGKHANILKTRDHQFVRDTKKWQLTEQSLRNQIEEIKSSPEYQKFFQYTSKRPNSAAVRGSSNLKEIADQLRGEKASLQLQIASLEDRSGRDIRSLENKIKYVASGKPESSNYENKAIANPLVPPTKPSSFKHYGEVGSASLLTPEAKAPKPKITSLKITPSVPHKKKSGASTRPDKIESKSTSYQSLLETKRQQSIKALSHKTLMEKSLSNKSLSSTSHRRQMRERLFKKSTE